MLSLEAVVHTVLYLIVMGIVWYLLWWLVDYCSLPEPFAKVARILLAVGAVFVLIGLLMGLAGQPLFRW